MENIITLKNVCYSYYDNIPALTNINLSVKKGELFSIIGLNGSGKSTLLHVINALIFPGSGEVLFKGSPVTEDMLKDKNTGTAFRQSMGYIFQNPDIQLFCPTVIDELMFAPLQLGLPIKTARERAEQIMDYLEISYLKDRPVYMLSGGEKKKVAIGSVLTLNPEVLLIDEPLASLDPKTQTFFINLLLELNDAGKTIVFTTHHLDLIDHLQPRVAVLTEGHTIERTGNASEILNDEKLLAEAGIIHQHAHKHGNEEHVHYHSHYVFHSHLKER